MAACTLAVLFTGYDAKGDKKSRYGVVKLHYLGIDLGGSNIAAGIIGEDYRLIAKGSTPTMPERGAAAIVQDMLSLIQELLQQTGIRFDEIPWVGIGTPGTANLQTGVIEFSNNLHFDNTPMAEMAEKLFDKKVYIENDANAAALGEYFAGAARGSSSSVLVILGTGVGSGIILDGSLYHGINYSGGEAGHTVIEYNGYPCGCGRRGCWEVYSSAPGLIRMTKEIMAEHPESAMWQMTGGSIDEVRGRTAFDAMRAGDSAAQLVVDRYIGYLSCGLVNLINIFQPEVLCLGGGISKEGEALIKPLSVCIERERYSKHSLLQTRLCTAALGNDAGIIGAALLGRTTSAARLDFEAEKMSASTSQR